jgi:hypothetical protein
LLLRAIFVWLSQASIFLPIISGLINYRRLTTPFRALLYFFLASIGFEVQSIVLIDLYHNNMPGLHLFTFVEFLTFSFVFSVFFRRKKRLSQLMIVNAVLFVLLAVADAFFVHGIWQVNTIARSYSSISILAYALIYFYFMFRLDERNYTIEHPMFWVSVGTLVYFGSNTLYFIFREDLIARGSTALLIGGSIHALLNIIANFLYAQSFRCFSPKTA